MADLHRPISRLLVIDNRSISSCMAPLSRIQNIARCDVLISVSPESSCESWLPLLHELMVKEGFKLDRLFATAGALNPQYQLELTVDWWVKRCADAHIVGVVPIRLEPWASQDVFPVHEDRQVAASNAVQWQVLDRLAGRVPGVRP